MVFYWPKPLVSFLTNSVPLLFVLYIGWYCGAGFYGLIRCKSPSPSLASSTSFNNNNNNNYMSEIL